MTRLKSAPLIKASIFVFIIFFNIPRNVKELKDERNGEIRKCTGREMKRERERYIERERERKKEREIERERERKREMKRDTHTHTERKRDTHSEIK